MKTMLAAILAAGVFLCGLAACAPGEGVGEGPGSLPDGPPASGEPAPQLGEDGVPEELDRAIREAIAAQNRGDYLPGECQGVGYKVMETFAEGDTLRVYALTEYVEYGFQDGVLVNVSGTNLKAYLEFKTGGGYELVSYTRLDAFSGLAEEELEELMRPLRETGKEYRYTDADLEEVRRQADDCARAYLREMGREAEVGERDSHEGRLLTQLAPDREALERIFKDERYSGYPDWTGEVERLENGTRMVYRTAYDGEQEQITFTKTEYDTGRVLERTVLDAAGGEPVE